VGAEIFNESLPVSEHMRELSNVREIVMGESDDYELIITCPPENTKKIRGLIASISNILVSEVGRITSAPKGISLVLSDSSKLELQTNGWDHFKG
jgi:thiamine monophosphate kinase